MISGELGDRSRVIGFRPREESASLEAEEYSRIISLAIKSDTILPRVVLVRCILLARLARETDLPVLISCRASARFFSLIPVRLVPRCVGIGTSFPPALGPGAG